jgi:hypothetical protein
MLQGRSLFCPSASGAPGERPAQWIAIMTQARSKLAEMRRAAPE